MTFPKSTERFDRSLGDVERLMEIHKEMGGEEVGKRVGLEPLNRSAIVLLTAVWEGLVEDLAAEALERLLAAAEKPDGLPIGLRRRVAKEIREDSHELAAWSLSGDQWKNYLRGRLQRFKDEDARSLNAPDSARVRKYFARALDIEDVTTHWYWPKMSNERAKGKLDELITRRGDIAHGGDLTGPATVAKKEVTDYKGHVARLAQRTKGAVNQHLTAVGA